MQAKTLARSHLGMLTPQVHQVGLLSPCANPVRGVLHPQVQVKAVARSHLTVLSAWSLAEFTRWACSLPVQIRSEESCIPRCRSRPWCDQPPRPQQ